MSTSTHPKVRRVEGIVPERRLLGAVLLIIGGIVAAGFVSDAIDQYTLAAISATLLVAFALSREYGYAIPAGITGGLGTAVLAITTGTFGPAATPAVLFLSIAAGFGAIWLLGLLADPQARHPWPLVPAALLGSLGVALASGDPGAVSWIQVGVAVVIVAAGASLLLRRAETRA